MKSINFKREMNLTVEQAVEAVTQTLKNEGFGVLTRIDFHSKIKEKIGKDLAPVVILGACDPNLAYQAYQKNSDITSLLPCNVVVRELGRAKVSVEIVKPTMMMEMLGDSELVSLAGSADQRLKKALETIKPA